MFLTIIFFLIIAAIVTFGIRRNVNFGIMGILAALCIAALVLGQSAGTAVTENFPVSLFFNLFITTLFYGFANASGAMKGVADRIVYTFRRRSELLPFVGYLTTIIVSAMGPGATATPIIVSPLLFSMAINAGYHPILASVAVWSGTMVGAAMPWMADWQTRTGTYQAILGDAYLPQINRSLWLLLFWFTVVYTVIYAAAYFFFGAYKIQGKELDMPKPKPFNRDQKISLGVVSAVIVIYIIPLFVELICPNPVTGWMKSVFTIQLLASAGAVILALSRVASCSDVVKNQIPWGTIITVCGMMFLMKYADAMNVVTTLGTPLERSSLPLWLYPAALLAVNGILTYFCDGRAVSPLLRPLCAVFVSLGCPAESVIISQLFGSTGPSLSPFSTGGAMALSGCPDDIREKTIRVQMIMPWAILFFTFVLSALGLFEIGCL